MEKSSLKKNNTYEQVQIPKSRKYLKNKWVYMLKMDSENLMKYKARLVVKGFNKKKKIDFDDIFSHAIKMSSIRVIHDLTISLDLGLE